MKKRIFFGIIFLLCCLTAFSPLTASAAYVVDANYEVHCGKYIVVSLDTGETVAAYNAESPNAPAGLVQVMTALLVVESVKDLDETFAVDEQAIREAIDAGALGVDLKTGEEMSYRDHLKRVLIAGRADSANALAIQLAGNIYSFVKKMNERARALGAKKTLFTDAVGIAGGQTTTCADMALICKQFVRHADLTEIIDDTRVTLDETNLSGKRTLFTTNYMIDPSYPKYQYRYAKGGKTGYSQEAGRCLFQTAEYDGSRYFAILLGCESRNEEGKSVRYDFTSARQLFRWAFLELERTSLVKLNEPLAEIKVTLSLATDYVGLVPEKDFTALVPKKDLDAVTYKPVLKSESVEAPIKQGDVLGYAEVYCSGQLIGRVNLAAQNDVSRNLALLLFDRVKRLLFSRVMLIILGVLAGIALIVAVLVLRHRAKYRRRHRSTMRR